MNKTYAFSDIHGNYEIWKQMENYIDETDTLYFLGDAGDRGGEGWKCIEEIYNHPQVTYLYGNHEDFFINTLAAFQDFLQMRKKYNFPLSAFEESPDFSLHINNGGRATFYQWVEATNCDFSWMEKLAKLPLRAEYTNKNGQKILMCHSGDYFSLLDYNVIWDRKKIACPWEGKDDEIIIHGHTSTPHFGYYSLEGYDDNAFVDPEIEIYCDGHKYDIDLGSAWTFKGCLLDLDTLEPIYFTSDGYEDFLERQRQTITALK